MSHDHNFKNLILDYPRQAIGFFAAVEAQAVDAGARILPIREEQLKERLGERFRELDVPLLVEWPDGRRAALLFVFEEETDPARFSIHRLAHYCLDLAELFATDRIVPVVIFLRSGGLYLAAVMDLCSRKIVGWAMAPSMPAEWVCEALRLAIGQKGTSLLWVDRDHASQAAHPRATRGETPKQAVAGGTPVQRVVEWTPIIRRPPGQT